MSRKWLVAIATVGAAAGLTIPAIAKTDGKYAQARDANALVLTVRYSGSVSRAGQVQASAARDPIAGSYSGYKCQVTAGTGPRDQTPTNLVTFDSTEFSIPYTQGGKHFVSVTSNCVGMLPPGTVHSESIVSHDLACRQYNPFDRSRPTIRGSGISTTYPDGMYSETCNTPNLKH